MTPGTSGSTQAVAVDELPSFRQALVAWITLCGKEGGGRAETDAWTAALADGAVFWRLGGPWTASRIIWRGTSVACVANRLKRIHASRANIDPKVAAWLGWADELRSVADDASQADWSRSIRDWSPANPLVRTIFAQSLADGLDKARLPREKAVALLPLLGKEQQQSQPWPLLPALGLPVDPDAYVYPCLEFADVADEWVGMRAAANEALQMMRETLLRQGPSAPADKSVSASLDKARRAAERLSSLVALVRDGWPISSDSLNNEWKQWSSALHEAAASRAAAVTPAAERLRAIVEKSKPWHDNWLARASREMLLADENTRDAVSPVAERTTAPVLSSPTSDSRPGGAETSDVTPAPADGDGKGDGDSSSVEFASLAELIRRARTTSADDEFARNFAARLGDLLEIGRMNSAPSSVANSRQAKQDQELLACLTTLDDLPLVQRRGLAWWAFAREELRRLVVVRAVYQILDEQLVGQRLAGRESLVEVVGFDDEARVLPGHISRVVRPGYVFVTTASQSSVLRRAQVEVATM